MEVYSKWSLFLQKKPDARTVKNIKIEFYSSLICWLFSYVLPFWNLTKLGKILSNKNKQKVEIEVELYETTVKKFTPAIRFGIVQSFEIWDPYRN